MNTHGPFGMRLTRRVVGLFIACALLPIVAAIALSYERVRDGLLEQRIGQIRDAAASYGSTLAERLRVADMLSRSIAQDVESSLSPGRKKDVMRVFRAAVVVERADRRAVFGDATRLPVLTQIDGLDARLATGQSALAVSRAGNEPRGVWLIRDSVLPAETPRRIALELDPVYLWGTRDDLPYKTDICALDTHAGPLHCTRPLSKAALATIRARIASEASGDFAWEANDARYLSGFLEIFLKGEFGTGAWFIVASQPEEYTFAPVHSVTQLVVTVVVLSLLVAALLGLIQVRRTLGPLQELSAATERIAARDFDTRVSEIQDNEFGALARAFNSMSARLGRQFQTLEAHGKIDAVLLSTVDMSQVAAIVIRRIAQLARADKYLLLLSDGTRAGTYRTYTTGSRDVLDGRSIVLPDTDARQLLAARDGTRAAGGGQFQIAALADIGSDYVFALPIALDAELAGAIVLGCDHDCWPDDDVISHLKELADRMAVALATARRDQELHRRAHFDALTQLPNRLLGLEELARAVAAAERHKRSLAVLFVDLDGFSTVNDTLGHYVGDQLLVQTAERLRRCVRKCDIVSRLGGDEFAVVTPEIREPDDAARVAMHVIEALTQPFYIGRDRAFVSVSVGIASFPGDGTNGEDLLRYADLAMYRAKRKGRGQIVFFEASMNADAQRRHLLERELSEALEQGQFELHYQPQLDLESDRITGAEALIRWNHPVRGIVMPDEFIGFAELSPLIEQIGSWVLQATCAQLMAWRASGLPIGHVSVNVSPRQFRNPGFAQVVAGTLSELAMPASMLRLEITESAVINNEGTVETNLASLADLGTPLELDDFGTGYSSLAYLQRLPIATVKLDRALIQNIETNQNDLAVVRAAVDMVHALGKTVVAEGVETAAQVEVLCRVKCDAIQGYYLSRPVPEAAFVQLVRDRAAEVSAAT